MTTTEPTVPASLERFYTPIPLAQELMAWHLRESPFARLIRQHALAGRVALSILEPYAGLGHMALGTELAVREYVATLNPAAQAPITPTIKLRGWEIDPEVLAAGPPWITRWDAGDGTDPLSPCAPPEADTRLLPLRVVVANPPWSRILSRLRQLRQLQAQVSTPAVPAPLLVLVNLQILESLQRIRGLWLPDPPDEVVVLARRVHWAGPDACYADTPKVGSALLVWHEPPRQDQLLTARTRLHFLENQAGGTNPSIRRRQEAQELAAADAQAETRRKARELAQATAPAAEGAEEAGGKPPRKRRKPAAGGAP